jgi:hypothetical protein
LSALFDEMGGKTRIMLQLAIILFNMTKIDLLLKNAHVVTMDNSFQLFPDGGVAIRDGEIISVGPSQDLEAMARL